MTFIIRSLKMLNFRAKRYKISFGNLLKNENKTLIFTIVVCVLVIIVDYVVMVKVFDYIENILLYG